MIASPDLATAERAAASIRLSVPASLRPSVPSSPDPWSPRDSQLLTAFLTSASHSLPHAAARAEVPLDTLLDWLDQPRVQSRIERIERATTLRARIIAAESRILALDALRTAASIHLHTFNTEDPAKIARLAETARKSASLLLRTAGAPGPRPTREPDPQTPPERGASRPPSDAPKSNSPSPQPEGLNASSRGWSESPSDTPGSPRREPAPRRGATFPNATNSPPLSRPTPPPKEPRRVSKRPTNQLPSGEHPAPAHAASDPTFARTPPCNAPVPA